MSMGTEWSERGRHSWEKANGMKGWELHLHRGSVQHGEAAVFENDVWEIVENPRCWVPAGLAGCDFHFKGIPLAAVLRKAGRWARSRETANVRWGRWRRETVEVGLGSVRWDLHKR